MRRGRMTGRKHLFGVGVFMVLGVVAAGLVLARDAGPPAAPELVLPLRTIAVVPLPGRATRFDYADVDPATHRLWLAHLGDGVLVEVDTAARQVWRPIPEVPGATGVIVVPALHGVFASAPGSGEVVTLDEDSGTVLAR